MKKEQTIFTFLITALQIFALTLAVGLRANARAQSDILAIGDWDGLKASNTTATGSTVKFFDAKTGKLLRSLAPGGPVLYGINGLIFDRHDGDLFIVNQNAFQNPNGEILRYNADGHFLGKVVADTNPNSPVAPRGIVIVRDGEDSRILFVADLGNPGSRGQLLAFRLHGTQVTFLGNLDPDSGSTAPGFHPRGVVLGPDCYLYVSLRNFPGDSSVGNLSGDCGGSIERFDPLHRTFKDVLLSNPPDCHQNINDLNRPEGLVFGPDGTLYITSFTRDGDKAINALTDTDKILILPKEDRISGKIDLPLDRIDLDVINQPRAYAQALLSGPDGHLYVPISNTGEVRSYNAVTKGYWQFVAPGTSLEQPLYLSFGKTNPATLVYDRH